MALERGYKKSPPAETDGDSEASVEARGLCVLAVLI